MVRFLHIEIILAIHDDQIRLYGGAYGLRDAAGLDAAFHMAAAYGFHLCQNHPFLDGNKRTAGMAMFTFLKLNGLEPVATESDYYAVMMAVASGNMTKEELADWLQTAVQGTPPDISVE